MILFPRFYLGMRVWEALIIRCKLRVKVIRKLCCMYKESLDKCYIRFD